MKRSFKGLKYFVLPAFAIGMYFAFAGNQASECGPQDTGCYSDSDCMENEFCDTSTGECINFFDCTVDEDCVKVDAGCCSCKQGGKSTAINKNYVNQWKDKLDCQPNTMCPDVYMCNGLELPTCQDGQCQLVKIPDKLYCEKDSDCVCGGFDVDGSCFLGNKLYYNAYVDKTGICPDFCGGFHGSLQLKCVDNKCTQVATGNTP